MKRIIISIAIMFSLGLGFYLYKTTPCFAGYCPGQSCFNSSECYGTCVCAKKSYEVTGLCLSID